MKLLKICLYCVSIMFTIKTLFKIVYVSMLITLFSLTKKHTWFFGRKHVNAKNLLRKEVYEFFEWRKDVIKTAIRGYTLEIK